MLRTMFAAILIVALTVLPAQAKRKLRIGAMQWAPYSSPSLAHGGIYVDLVQQAFARSGHDVEIGYYPWKRALQLICTGELDGLIGAGYTAERTEFMSYSHYAWESSFHFFSLGSGPEKVTSYADLCPARLGQVRGTRVTSMVEKMAPCLHIEFVPNVESNLEKLIYGRVDYVINTPETMHHLIRESYPEKLTELRRIDPPLERVKIFTVFSKQISDWREVTTAFDAGIESLKLDHTYEAILDRHAMPN